MPPITSPTTDYTFDPGLDPTSVWGPYASMLLQYLQLATPNGYRGMVIVSPTTPATTGQPSGYPTNWYAWQQRCLWLNTTDGFLYAFNTGTSTWKQVTALIPANSITTAMIQNGQVTPGKFSTTGVNNGDVWQFTAGAWGNVNIITAIGTGALPLAALLAGTTGQIPQTNSSGQVVWFTPTASWILSFLTAGSIPIADLTKGSALQVLRTQAGSGCVPGSVTLVSNQVTAIAVSNGGSGYTSAPYVTISGGGGVGATATATISGGVVTGFVITNGGSGYTGSPTVSVTTGPEWATVDQAVAFLGTDSGAANAYTVAVASQFYVAGAGQFLVFAAQYANTGNSTLNSLPLYNSQGGNLTSGQITAGMFCLCYFNGTNYYLINPSAAASSTFVSSQIAIPTTAGTGGLSTGQAHGFGAVPTEYSGYLVNTTTEGGYNVGDKISLTQVTVHGAHSGGDSFDGPAFGVKADATNVYAVFNGPLYGADSTSYRLSTTTNAVGVTFTPANWKIVIVAHK